MSDPHEHLSDLERRVCEKWIRVAAERASAWGLPEMDLDMSAWAEVAQTPLPSGTMQFPREQWVSYPAKRTYILLLADRMLDLDMDEERWMQVCLLMQYGGKTRL